MLSNNVPENFVAFNKRKRCFRWDNNSCIPLWCTSADLQRRKSE